MLRVVVVLLLVVTACAQQCVTFQATPTAGMCKDYNMNGVRCTSSSTPTSDKISAAVVDSWNAINPDKCQETFSSSSTCPSFGGKLNPDLCKIGGHYCKTATLPQCKTDAHCAKSSDGPSMMPPIYCCSAFKNQINLLCTGVNSSALDTYISQMKKEPANSKSSTGTCRDTDCIDWSSASSLCTMPIVLPAVALLAITISFFGQR
jgi:hypothetical protein